MTFYVTFGQKYPEEPHPRFADAHRDGWIEVEAPDALSARHRVIAFLGTAWAFMYTADDFNDSCFPLGCLLTLKADPVSM